MALWVIAFLLLPIWLNEADKAALKIYKFYKALKGRKRR